MSPLLILALVAVLAVGAWLVVRAAGNKSEQSQAGAQAQASPAAAPAAEVPEVNRKPHPQAALPPLPFSPAPPARPAEVVRDVYKFAAEHPEVLSYMPCYCGCERSGHRGNEDCFVTARDANGDVTEWEPHGMT